MSNAIGAVGTSQRIPARIDPVGAASNTLAKVDTKNQGYIDKEELQAAVTKSASNQSSGAKADASNVDALFKKLDANGDGKIDKQELTDGFKKLSAELDNNHSQVNAGRAKLEGGAHAGGPPHGGGGGAEGANESSSASSANKVYDPADTNQDGTVSAAELLAYQISTAEKQNTSTTATSTTPATTTASTSNSSANKDNTVIQNSDKQARDDTSQLLMQLTRAYASSDQNTAQPGSTISINA